jgi:hypothetical protein
MDPSDLAGYLCEQCLDAPAVAVVPAPGGGEMGICATCADPPPVRPPVDERPHLARMAVRQGLRNRHHLARNRTRAGTDRDALGADAPAERERPRRLTP